MSHQSAPSHVRKPRSLRAPFSSYLYVETRYNGALSIRRLFSQSRALEGATLLEEDIPAEGLVADENEQIRSLHSDYRQGGLRRLSFWKQPFESTKEVKHLSPDD